MQVNSLYKGVLVAVTLCVAPAALPASSKAASPDSRTVAVGPAASPDISSHLEQMRIDAVSIENEADQLQMLMRQVAMYPQQGDAPLLSNVREDVNQMNRVLFYLREHQAEASPLQQRIIQRVAAPAVELAGTTDLAIETLNNNETHLYTSDLPGLADAMFKEASRVDQTVGDLDKYINARHEEQELRQTLGLKNNS